MLLVIRSAGFVLVAVGDVRWLVVVGCARELQSYVSVQPTTRSRQVWEEEKGKKKGKIKKRKIRERENKKE